MGAVMGCIAIISGLAWFQDATLLEAESITNEVMGIVAFLIGGLCFVAEFFTVR
jgi:hypothetical protein